MEEFENRLFDLLEAKTFDQLTSAEKNFVLQHISEEEYQLQWRIMTEADELTFDEVEPLPLVVTGKKNILTRTIPMYQVLIGAACLLIGFFLFSPDNGKELNVVVSPTVFSLATEVGTPQFIHDTIREKFEMRLPARVIKDTITLVQTVFVNKNETRMLEAGNTLNTIPLDRNLLETRTLSAKDDGSIGLLPNLNNYGSMK